MVQESNFADRIWVIVGPANLCAPIKINSILYIKIPEQFIQTITPSSIDTHLGPLVGQSAQN